MSGLAVWTEALNLPGFEVVEAEIVPAMLGKSEGMLRLTVAPKLTVAVCEDVHQTRVRDGIRDLPVADRAVELRVRGLKFSNCLKAPGRWPGLWERPSLRPYPQWPIVDILRICKL